MKVSKYMKDGKVRLARYVTYNCTAWCPPSAYPAKISYVQSCADAVADCPPYLIVTIAGATGSCDLVYYARFSTAFACEPIGTVVNPDCPPAGWTVVEADTGVDEVCAAVGGSDLTGLACVYAEYGTFYGDVAAARVFIVDAACASISYAPYCNGMGNILQYGDCASPVVPVSGFTTLFKCPVVDGGFGEVSVTQRGYFGSESTQGYWVADGFNSSVAIDEYCRPTGSYSIPISFWGGQSGFVPMYWGTSCLCSPPPIASPVAIGNITVTFGACP